MYVPTFPAAWWVFQVERGTDLGVRFVWTNGQSYLIGAVIEAAPDSYYLCFGLLLEHPYAETVERDVQHLYREHWTDVLDDQSRKWRVVATHVNHSAGVMMQMMCREWLAMRDVMIKASTPASSG